MVYYRRGKTVRRIFYEPGTSTTIKLGWRRTLVLFIFMEQIKKSPIYPLQSIVITINDCRYLVH